MRKKTIYKIFQIQIRNLQNILGIRTEVLVKEY
jgi:hypothetical protein